MSKNIWKSYKLPIILLFSIIIGCIVGIIFKEDATKLKPLGTIFVNLLYTIVVPLVFFTISSSISRINNFKKVGKIFIVMFVVFVATSTIVSIFTLISVKLINPVGNVNIDLVKNTKETFDIGNKIVDMVTVSEFNQLLSKNNMLPLIVFTVIVGFSIGMLKDHKEKISRTLSIISDITMNSIKIIMYYAPIGLFAYFASLIGEYGSKIVENYLRGAIFYYVLAFIYFIIFYTLYSYISRGSNGVKIFYKNIFTSIVTSIGTCSSIASLPSNLKCAENLKIDKDISSTTLAMGATIHMEGSCMASILKIVFLFSIFNKSFTGIDTYFTAIVISVLSGVVMSGIPGGAFIGEMLIVSLYKFPIEAFPIIATIGWITDPPGTCLNVVGDISSSLLVEKFVTKNRSANE